ncbi:MAG: ABC transporter ATP-binding protein [Deltaproteobacteria bacterium]|nr:ABC transporter ATP-binding protein [Deltaproteobacteria bacterium]
MHGYDKLSSDLNLSNKTKVPIIHIKGVSKRFGELEAVGPTDLDIEGGIIFGLIGSDGAGKSTLLRMLATMIRPTRGRITIDGLDTIRQKTGIKVLIGYMPQRFGLYQDLTVGENLDFFMDIFGISAKERKRRRERYLGFSNLLPFLERPAGALSGGMKQKLGLACVLVHEPKILILDEPTNGVDPVSRKEFWDILFEMKGEGMTIVISTAYLDEGEKCDRLALMHKSRIIESGAPGLIREGSPDLEEAMIRRIKDVDQELVHDRFGI